MNITFEQIWTAAGILLGFQITSFTWRVSREIIVGEKQDLTWLPIADVLNLISMLLTVIGVFILPILNRVGLIGSKYTFGLATILFIGYPFALAGHYDMYNNNTRRSYKYCPLQEKIVFIVVLVVVIAYVIYWAKNAV